MVIMEYTKENSIISASRRGRRRMGSALFLGEKALGLTYICYLNGYHWYL